MPPFPFKRRYRASYSGHGSYTITIPNPPSATSPAPTPAGTPPTPGANLFLLPPRPQPTQINVLGFLTGTALQTGAALVYNDGQPPGSNDPTPPDATGYGTFYFPQVTLSPSAPPFPNLPSQPDPPALTGSLTLELRTRAVGFIGDPEGVQARAQIHVVGGKQDFDDCSGGGMVVSLTRDTTVGGTTTRTNTSIYWLKISVWRYFWIWQRPNLDLTDILQPS